MFITLFNTLRSTGVPCTLRELLDLIGCVDKNLAFGNMEEFYYLSRATLVKDEKHYDKFDRAFDIYFKGIESIDDILEMLIPEEWLKAEFEKYLTEEELEKIESLGGLEKLLDEFKKRIEEQKERHEGGDKWVATKGTSPFGNEGQNPEGIRVGGEGKQKKAVKVWDKRNFRDFDDAKILDNRGFQVALKKLRQWARTGSQEEFDIEETIRDTAKNGYLEIKTRKEKENSIKILLFLDVGGSMDDHIQNVEKLFNAARNVFKNLNYFYFHNCIYESVWTDNYRRNENRIETQTIINKFTKNHKVIIIGDASMAPYELTNAGGSIEHWNKEAGELWLKKIKSNFYKTVWLNPVHEDHWDYTSTISMISGLMEKKMYPLTISGISDAVAHLSRRH